MPRVTIDGHDDFDIPEEQPPGDVPAVEASAQILPAKTNDRASELRRILANPAVPAKFMPPTIFQPSGPSSVGPLLGITTVVFLLTAAVVATHAYHGRTLLAQLEPDRASPETPEPPNPHVLTAIPRGGVPRAAAPPPAPSFKDPDVTRASQASPVQETATRDVSKSAPAPPYAEAQSNLRERLLAGGLTGVDAEVTGGRALLTGLVSRSEQRIEAETFALATPGIQSVRNEIDISGPLPSLESKDEDLALYPSYPHPYVRAEAPYTPESVFPRVATATRWGEPVNALARAGAVVALSALAELAARKGWSRRYGNQVPPYSAYPQAAPLPYGAISQHPNYGNPWRR